MNQHRHKKAFWKQKLYICKMSGVQKKEEKLSNMKMNKHCCGIAHMKATLAKLLNLFVSHFPLLQNGQNSAGVQISLIFFFLKSRGNNTLKTQNTAQVQTDMLD